MIGDTIGVSKNVMSRVVEVHRVAKAFVLWDIILRSGCCQTSGSSEKSDKSLVTDVWQQRKVG